MYKQQTIAVVIPALNEVDSIGNVVRELRKLRGDDGQQLIDDIVVCDNGSSDDTAFMAESAGARVVHEHRKGYGSACLTGIAALKVPDIVVFVDADRSVVVNDIYSLLDDVTSGVDLVIGSRIRSRSEEGALTLPQRVGNLMASRLIRFLWRYPVTDLGPFRAIRYPRLVQLKMQNRRFGWTVEMQVKAIINKMIVTEVPVSSLRRIGRSKISGTVSGVIGAACGIFGMIFKLWLSEASIRQQSAPVEMSTVPFYPNTDTTYTKTDSNVAQTV